MLILFSGGLESTSLVVYAINKGIKNINLLYIKSGYRWESAEVYHAKKIAKFYQGKYKDIDISLDILDLDIVFDLKHIENIKSVEDNILPIRNLFLLTNASMYALKKDTNKILIGIQHSLDYPDTSEEYIHTIEKLIKIGSGVDDFEIIMPFYNLDKDSIIDTYSKEIPLKYVFSCTEPIQNNRCGKCFKCEKLNKIRKSLK